MAVLESSLDDKKGIGCSLNIRILKDSLAILLVKKVKWGLWLGDLFGFQIFQNA